MEVLTGAMDIMKQATAIKMAVVGVFSAVLIWTTSCDAQNKTADAKKVSAVHEIKSAEEFKALLDTSGNRLLVFDLYADWCMPCRILSPIIEKLAIEHKGKASFYKVNTDRQLEVAAAFGVQGIPFVVFVRNKTGLEALTGVHPPETYVRLINQLSSEENPAADVDTPDGTIEDGVRVIRLTPEMAIGNLVVYRGETVRIVMENLPFTYSISIPQYKASGSGQKGKVLDVTFKAEEVGVFPIYCNGDCPSGDGSAYGQVTVLPYKGQTGSSFEELTAEKANDLIKAAKPLILDVRTPNEFYDGHIEGATLIPLQQLEGRLSEIEAYKNKPILVYCRSGNRSTVAAQILARKGFTTLYNLRPGVKGWQAAKLPLVTTKAK
jgi:thioredoxin